MHKIINADCLDAMRDMPDNSIDAIVTDPPYGLSFMGAKWDSFNGSNGRQTIKERQDEGKRYAAENKGAPRYGNSHGKRVTRDEMVAFQQAMTPIFEEALRVAKPGAHLLCFGGTRTYHRITCAIEEAGWVIKDCIMWVYGSGMPHGQRVDRLMEKRYPNAAPEWEGWNTQLKPAWEPIIVARKPLDGTVAHNVMKHGTGAINIDGCRVPTEEFIMTNGVSKEVQDRQSIYGSYGEKKTGQTAGQKLGRFPANLVHDGSQEVLELFPQTSPSKKGKPRTGKSGNGWGMTHTGAEYEDSGTAARFFYCAKASKRDRGEGNNHPTVKPNTLMRWLVRLVCPQGGIVLDPFMGSGSTGVACVQEGMRFVGVEMDQHYCEIAEGRIENEPLTVFNEI